MQLTRIDRNQALSLYKEKTGRGISYQGLFYLAKRNNFIEQAEDGFHYYYIKEKMEMFLNLILNELPVGYMTTKQLAEKYNKSYNRVYNIMLTAKYIEHGERKVKAYKKSDYLELTKDINSYKRKGK
jgi:hypothetical protein